jgi:hypothetical protein
MTKQRFQIISLAFVFLPISKANEIVGSVQPFPNEIAASSFDAKTSIRQRGCFENEDLRKRRPKT